MIYRPIKLESRFSVKQSRLYFLINLFSSMIFFQIPKTAVERKEIFKKHQKMRNITYKHHKLKHVSRKLLYAYSIPPRSSINVPYLF